MSAQASLAVSASAQSSLASSLDVLRGQLDSQAAAHKERERELYLKVSWLVYTHLNQHEGCYSRVPEGASGGLGVRAQQSQSLQEHQRSPACRRLLQVSHRHIVTLPIHLYSAECCRLPF